MIEVVEQLTVKAKSLGFDQVGVFPIAPSETISIYTKWLELGYAGKMEYLHRHAPYKKTLALFFQKLKA